MKCLNDSVPFKILHSAVLFSVFYFHVLCWLKHYGVFSILGSRALNAERHPGIGWEPFPNLLHHKHLREQQPITDSRAPPPTWFRISIGGTWKSICLNKSPRRFLKTDKFRKHWLGSGSLFLHCQCDPNCFWSARIWLRSEVTWRAPTWVSAMPVNKDKRNLCH